VPDSKPTAKPISIKLDYGLGNALREYKRATRIPIADIVYRALICYWASQKSPEAATSLAIADMYPGEEWDVLDVLAADNPEGESR